MMELNRLMQRTAMITCFESMVANRIDPLLHCEFHSVSVQFHRGSGAVTARETGEEMRLGHTGDYLLRISVMGTVFC